MQTKRKERSFPMKRTHSIFVIMAVVVAALCLASCEETTPVVGERKTFYGKWKCNFTTSDTPPEGVLFRIRKGDVITFNNSGSYDLVHSDGKKEHGLWLEKQDRILSFKPDAQPEYFNFTYTALDENILTLMYSSDYRFNLRRLKSD